METLVKKIINHGLSQPDKLAVGFKDAGISYRELAGYALGTAEVLQNAGIKKGDHVLFTALSKPEMVVIYLGLQYLGAVAVFMDKNITPANAGSIYRDSDGVLYITDKDMADCRDTCRLMSLKELYGKAVEAAGHIDLKRALEEYEEPAPEQIIELLFTTGTTGKPKGVMLSAEAVYHIFTNNIEGIGIREDEILLEPLPLNHSFALRVLRAVLYRGATVVLQNGFTFARETELNIEKFRCTAYVTVPASLEIVYSQMQDKFAEIMGRLRYIEVGAGSLTVEQRKRYTRILPDTVIYNVWGSSETGGALFVNVSQVAADEQKVMATGRPLPGIMVSTVDDAGNETVADRDHPARMRLQGRMVMSGYYKRPDLNAVTFQDGWLLTSDMIYTDADGYVYMMGRADDIINVGGEKVSPIEIENIACEYEHISECACIGVEDPEGKLGQIPVLFVVPVDSFYSSADMTLYISEKCERYKLPRRYVALDALPRNAMQKIDRNALRTKWEEICSVVDVSKASNLNLMNPVIQSILTRRSIRRFTDKPIARNVVELLVKCGYHAPSGHNMQTWKFTVVGDRQKIEELKAAAQIASKEQKVTMYGFENPQVVILISNDIRNNNSCQDASCAAENIILAAHSLGLGSVWLNVLRKLRDKEPVRSVLDALEIPENHVVWSMVALGWPETRGAKLAKKENVVRWFM